jgi:hypothetical protein
MKWTCEWQATTQASDEGAQRSSREWSAGPALQSFMLAEVQLLQVDTHPDSDIRAAQLNLKPRTPSTKA